MHTTFEKSFIEDSFTLNGKGVDELPPSARFLFSWFSSGKRAFLFLLLSPFMVMCYLVLNLSESTDQRATHPKSPAKRPAAGGGRRRGAGPAVAVLPSTLSYLAVGAVLPFVAGWGIAPLLWLSLAGVWAAQDRLVGMMCAEAGSLYY